MRRCIMCSLVLGLVGCNAGSTPDSTPPVPVGAAPWFEDVTAASGLAFEHVSGHNGTDYLLPEIMAGGGALFDMDDDGDLDAYLVQSGSLYTNAAERPGNRLFRNDGAGVFTDVTEDSGAEDRGYGMGVATGDYDGDGDVDLYVTNVGANTLLANDGTGIFTDVTAGAGVGDAGWGTSASFFDYDADGDLDLYATNYLTWSKDTEIECYNDAGGRDYCSPKNYNAPAMDVLYRNDGDGTFTDVTRTAQLDRGFGPGLGVVAGDFNGDGRLDLFIANDGMPDQLWINRGDGTFVDNAAVAGCGMDMDGTAKAGMGVAAADVDDDGDLDLLVVNLRNESDSFYRNEGTWFEDRTAEVGLGRVSRPFTRFGLAFVDFDLDGYLDIYQANGRVQQLTPVYGSDPFAEPNMVLRGTPSGRYEEVLPRGGTADLLAATSRAAAIGDIDGDGAPDVLVVNRDGAARVLRNVAGGDRAWIRFDVRERNGAPAIGAQLRVDVGARRITRDVRTCSSYCAASDPRVHLGLGSAPDVDAVSVRWGDGTVERFGAFATGRSVRLVRGAGTVSTEGSP